MARTRSLPTGYYSGGVCIRTNKTTGAYKSTAVQTLSQTAFTQTCTDALSIGYPHNLTENPFDLKRFKEIPLRMGGYVDWSWGTRHNYDQVYLRTVVPGLTYMSPDLVYWETQAISRMNPSNPVVDLPLFTFELKDFPRMLRDIGRVKSGAVKASDVPGGYLAYNFGWAPLFSDLKKLLSLQEAIDQRFRSLERKRRHKRVRLLLDESEKEWYQSEDVTYFSINSLFANSKLIKRKQRQKIWAVFDYVVDGDLPGSSDVRPYLGLGGLSYATIWNALPWSWLVDYLSNVGDFLNTYRGYVPYKLENFNIMAHTFSEASINTEVLPFPTVSYSNGNVIRYERKQRRNSTVARPRVRFGPALSEYQTSILGALALASALRSIKR